MAKRTLLDKVANWLGYVKEVAVSTVGALNLPSHPSNKAQQYLAGYKGWVYGCVKARSNDVATIKLHLFKVKSREKRETEEVFDHDVLSLLHSVNPFMTFRDLVFNTQANKDLAGEAFWLLVRNAQNNIIGIWPLRPDWIVVKTDSKEFIKGYEYRVPSGKPIPFDIDDIIHFKNFNPLDPYRGLSIIKAAAATIDTETFSEEYNRKFFENEALPTSILSTEQKLSDQQMARMKAEWKNEYGGIKKSHKMAILEGGLELKPFQLSQKEMDFLEGQKFTRDKIFALFQTPKTVLGMTEDVTVSNAEATNFIFSQRVVKPEMEMFRDVLNEFLLPKFKDGDNLFFTFDDPVPENQEAKINELKGLFSVGALSPNEARQMFGLDQIDDDSMDSFYLPVNLLPVGSESEPAKGTRGSQEKITIPYKPIKRKLIDDTTKQITQAIMKDVAKSFLSKDSVEPSKCDWPIEKQERAWKQFVNKAINFEKLFQKRVKDIFARQEKETLKRLESTAKALSARDIDKILIRLTRENKLSAEILIPILREFLEESGNDSLDHLGLDDIAFDTTTASVREFLNVNALKGIKGMNKHTKALLRRELAIAVEEGFSIPEVARTIKNIYKQASTVRAVRIARTEILKAGNRGALEAYKQSGVVVSKEWFTALDERVCQWCNPLHGKVVSVDKVYFNEGETFIGEKGGKLNFRLDDVVTPPLHPSCRCTLIPVTITQRAQKPIEKSDSPEPYAEDPINKEKELVEKVKDEVAKDMDKKLSQEIQDIKKVIEDE